MQTRTTVSCNRARITQNRTNPAYIRKWMTQIHGIRFLPKTFVGRMQYAPTRGRKWYARGCGVRDWERKWYVQGCGIRFLPKTFVGRMQYAPTRGRKRYAQDCGIRFLPKTSVGRIQYAPTRGRKWYAQDCGIHDWTQKRYVQGRKILVWDREGRVRSCRGIA